MKANSERVERRPRSSARVFVVGSLNLDTALTVRIHPRPGQTISASAIGKGVGGKGANQAIAVAKSGARVDMIGAVGHDRDGEVILAGLRHAGVTTSGVHARRGPSGTAHVIVDEFGENMIVVAAGANESVDDEIVDVGMRDIQQGDVLVLQNEIPPLATARAAERGRSSGATVIWNAAPAPLDREDIPADLDILVVNEGELRDIARLLEVAADDLIDSVKAVSTSLHSDVVCTVGADGVLAILGGVIHRVGAPSVSAVDTTAAGDTFVGYFAAGSALPPAERLKTAAAAGAAAVTRRGAASSIPDHESVLALLAS